MEFSLRRWPGSRVKAFLSARKPELRPRKSHLLCPDFQEIMYLPQSSPALCCRTWLETQLYHTNPCYFAPGLVRVIEQTIFLLGNHLAITVRLQVIWIPELHCTLLLLGNARCCASTLPLGTKAASRKGTYAAVQPQNARVSSHAPMSRQAWSSQPCCSHSLLSKGSRCPLVQAQHWPTRATDKACKDLAALQESWGPDSLDSGSRAVGAHHTLPARSEALRLHVPDFSTR